MKALEVRGLSRVETPRYNPRVNPTQTNGYLSDIAVISQGQKARIVQGNSQIPDTNGHVPSKLERLGDSYFEKYFAFHPEVETGVGIPGHEAYLPDYREASVHQEKKLTQTTLRKLLSIPKEGLSREEKLDYVLFKEWLNSKLLELSDENHKRDPSFYGTGLVEAIFDHLVYPSDSKIEDLKNLTSKLFLFPKLVKQGMENLSKKAPKLWVERELDDLPSSMEFIRDLKKSYQGVLREKPSLRVRLDLGIKTAAEALKNYQRFLKEKLLPIAEGEYAVGQARLAYSLKHSYHVKESLDDLLKITRKEIRETKKKMEKLAREIDPSKSPEQILKNMERERPRLSEFKKVYKHYTREARQFLINHDLVTLPNYDQLQVIPTPKFLENEHPTAACYSPKPFGDNRRGTFVYTRPPRNLPVREFNKRLGQHNYYSIRNNVVHEAYPGHHVQFARANEIKESRLRRLIGELMDNDIKVEGWGLYSERIMFEEGFANSKKDEMMRLEWLLHRQMRLVLAIQLHTKALSLEEAVDSFIKEVPRVPRSVAEAEMAFFTQSPTQPLSYVLGYREIMSLRKSLQEKLGDWFSLKAFHDAVLNTGNLPIGLVRDRIEKEVISAAKEGNTLGG